GGDERLRELDRRGLTISSIAFVALLVLALVWPAPVVWLNEKTFDAPIEVDSKSFLGREAAQWDVVFWAIAGIFVLALFHAKNAEVSLAWAGFRNETARFPRRVAERWRTIRRGRIAVAALAGSIVVAAVWIFCDSPLLGVVESADSEIVRDVIRIFNRLGGGMNPLMIIVFFALAGMLFAHPYWSQMAVAMAAAAAGAGIVVQILKVAVGRTRPELWLGPFHHVFPSASSFPSGHTVGAFAIAGVITFASRSIAFRGASLLIATAVAFSRVLTFRHWPSDVVASAMIGLAFGWFFAGAIRGRDVDR
ncbi:MAG TPA: phosphatase PAP2 family protein, partial [Thermoanaerobaculia bacterium]|nr:phosphatase PAP2 family protein [Thermoanaerobaculia bacterium]